VFLIGLKKRKREKGRWWIVDEIYIFIPQSYLTILSSHILCHIFTIFRADGEFDGEISNLRPNNPDDIFPYLFNMVRR